MEGKVKFVPIGGYIKQKNNIEKISVIESRISVLESKKEQLVKKISQKYEGMYFKIRYRGRDRYAVVYSVFESSRGMVASYNIVSDDLKKVSGYSGFIEFENIFTGNAIYDLKDES